MGTIALALGEERTRNELIPFLTDSNDDEDEVGWGVSHHSHTAYLSVSPQAQPPPLVLFPTAQVLLIMAEELGKFIPLVGGPAHGQVLLMPLEALSMVEETVVRDKAVDSINLIAAELPEAIISEHLIPLVQVSGASFRKSQFPEFLTHPWQCTPSYTAAVHDD